MVSRSARGFSLRSRGSPYHANLGDHCHPAGRCAGSLRGLDRAAFGRPLAGAQAFSSSSFEGLGACGDVPQGHQLVHLGRQDLATVLRCGGLFAAVVDAGFQCGARLGRASSKRDHNAAAHAHPTSPRRRQSPIRLHQLRPMGRDVPAGGSNRVHRGQPLARPRRQL